MHLTHTHIDGATLHAYVSRSFDDERLRALDDHVDSCLRCSLAVESAGLAPDRWVRRGPLARLVRVAPPAVAQPAVGDERRAA
jgi:hypothetical protein